MITWHSGHARVASPAHRRNAAVPSSSFGEAEVDEAAASPSFIKRASLAWSVACLAVSKATDLAEDWSSRSRALKDVRARVSSDAKHSGLSSNSKVSRDSGTRHRGVGHRTYATPSRAWISSHRFAHGAHSSHADGGGSSRSSSWPKIGDALHSAFCCGRRSTRRRFRADPNTRRSCGAGTVSFGAVVVVGGGVVGGSLLRGAGVGGGA
mmetsp:Transcript_15397/g.46593  ORF Transcript_15397/g.46593 Transcript_15397/m.46593 type:complete len:209 (-) Transcript_15397:244-870(-)